MNARLPAISTAAMLILLACNTSGYGQNSNEDKKIMESMTYPVRNISVSINRSAAEVYQFASNPKNFSKWVAFVKSMKEQGDSWTAETTLGVIKIKFTPQNDFGIIDHQVTLTNGEVVNNSMRVIPNNKGCEFVFTLFRMPGKTEDEFKDDIKAVTADLQKLKEIMERMTASERD